MLRTFLNNSRVVTSFHVTPTALFSSLLGSNQSRTLPNLTFSRRTLSANLAENVAKTERIYYPESENQFAYKILPKIAPPPVLSSDNQEFQPEELESFLARNWRESNATEIVQAFDRLRSSCSRESLDLGQERFNNLVDGLMDHCEKLTDDELLRLIYILKDYPQLDSIYERNYFDVWTCLDDMCCWKSNRWTIEKKFIFANAWYALRLARVSDYVFEMLDSIPRKKKFLDHVTILYTCFYYNVCRKRAIEFDFEDLMAKVAQDMTVDELGIVALAYFKTQSKVKMTNILTEMVKKVTANSETVHEITLTAILKTLRHSQRSSIVPELEQMLDKLIVEIHRLSNSSLVHLALVGTTMQYCHEPTLKGATLKILSDLESIRLKDIERILLANSMFGFDPGEDFYERCMKELNSDKRIKESIQYDRCLPSALNFLSLVNLYSHSLMDRFLDEDYIRDTFGKNVRAMPREMVCLDIGIDVEVEDYHGNRLPEQVRRKACKWMVEYTPTHDQWKSFSPYDKFYLDFADHVAEVVGSVDMMAQVHALPQYSKSDIILCKDRNTGEFVKPLGVDDYVLGDVYRPTSLDRYDWYAFVTLVPNLVLRNTMKPLGVMLAKERQLKRLGYKPLYVGYDFPLLEKESKMSFIREKLGCNT